jgi:hypothetical protein
MTINLSREAVLVKATFHSWTGDKRVDSKTANEFNTSVEAKDTAMRHTKKLLSKSENAMNCRTLIGNARKFLNENSVPWTYDGVKLIPNKNFQRVQDEMAEYESKIYNAASLLFESFNRDVRDDREILGKLFDEAAYIMPHQVFDKFKIDLQYEPIVDATKTPQYDAISSSVEKMMEQTRERQESVIRNATDNLRGRIETILTNTIDRLENIDDKSKKPTALLRSIEELADVLPRLNIAGDPDIAMAAMQMKERILYYSAQDLKDDEASRTMVMQAAREIAGTIGRKIKMPVKQPESVSV